MDGLGVDDAVWPGVGTLKERLGRGDLDVDGGEVDGGAREELPLRDGLFFWMRKGGVEDIFIPGEGEIERAILRGPRGRGVCMVREMGFCGWLAL
jgi:hypothetical protein